MAMDYRKMDKSTQHSTEPARYPTREETQEMAARIWERMVRAERMMRLWETQTTSHGEDR